MADLDRLRSITAQLDHYRANWERLVCDLVAEGNPISHVADAAGISRTHVRRICFGKEPR